MQKLNVRGMAARRRKKVAPLVREIQKWNWEYVAACNVCGSRERAIVAHSDRYGFGNRAAVCLTCGLCYLVDRLTKDAYGDYYKRHYRAITSDFWQRTIDVDFLRRSARRYGQKLIHLLRHEFEIRPDFTVLDVGGSTGDVAAAFQSQFGCKATVLDPAQSELEAAKLQGLDTLHGMLEDLPKHDRQFDLILVCRTIEHFFDLKSALEILRKHVKPNGLVFIDFMDLMVHSQSDGCAEMAMRLDHCFVLDGTFAPALFERFGFQILSIYNSPAPGGQGYLLRAAEVRELEVPVSEIRSHVTALLNLEMQWQSLPVIGEHTLADRVKLQGYRAAQRLGLK